MAKKTMAARRTVSSEMITVAVSTCPFASLLSFSPEANGSCGCITVRGASVMLSRGTDEIVAGTTGMLMLSLPETTVMPLATQRPVGYLACTVY